MKVKLASLNLKDLIKTEQRTSKEGKDYTLQTMELDLFMLREPKVIKSYENSDHCKVGFICLPQSEEQKDAKEKQVEVGILTNNIRR